MGQIGVSLNNGQMRTLLGSCIGLALIDRRLKLAGLAHIVLPDSPQASPENPGKYASTAIPALIQKMQALAGNEKMRLQAKVAGGANMFAASGAAPTIGDKNLEAVERLLDEQRITIVGRHCGGEQGRRMTLDPATGIVTIEIVGADIVIL